MVAEKSLKGFAIVTLILEAFFAIIYAFHQGYVTTPSFSDFSGLISAIYLVMLLLVGFGLMTTYLQNFSLGGLILTFILLTFTLQWYFLMKKFWYSINLADPVNKFGLGDNLYNIRLVGLLHYVNNQLVQDMQYFTLSEAVASAICMFVALFSLIGRLGPLQLIITCFFGIFSYTLNECSFWRLGIADNGYGMRIFLFGSVMGLAIFLVLGKMQYSINHEKYRSRYSFQTFAFMGYLFVWILLPFLSVIQQTQLNGTTLDFRQVAPLNIWFALSASSASSFAASILIRGRILVHDVIFSGFAGAVAYGSSSNVFPNPFPAMMIGFFMGIAVTFLNTKKRSLNSNGVVDSLGSIYLFLIPSFIGTIYSSILFASSPYGPDNSRNQVQMDPGRSRFGQGGFQLIGLLITVCIAVATGAFIGFILKKIDETNSSVQLFEDSIYIQKSLEAPKKRRRSRLTRLSKQSSNEKKQQVV